jgi:hypothetical protein
VSSNDGRISRRPGYESLAGSTGETVLSVFNFEHGDVVDTIVVTNVDIYKYDSGSWTSVLDAGNTLDGDESDWVDWEVATDANNIYAIVTNNKNDPKVSNDDTISFEDWNDSCGIIAAPKATGWTCRCVISHYGRLLIGNIDSDHTSVSWSVYGDFGDWSGEGSGSVYFSKARGEIVRMVPVGDRIAVFGQNSIDLMTYVGGDIIYATEHVVDDTRLLSGRSIVSVGPYILFMGERDIYLFDGTRVIRPVGGPIVKEYRRILDRNNLHKAFAFHDQAKELVYFTIPSTESGHKTYVLKYDIYDTSNLVWFPYEYSYRPTAMGFYVLSEDTEWDDYGEADLWSGMEGIWSDYSLRSGFPSQVIGTSEGEVYNIGYTLRTDDGSDFSSYWESIDLVSPQYESLYMRWLELEIEIKTNRASENVNILYSSDMGETWTLAETITVDRDWDRYQVNVDVKSRMVRFKVEGDFEMRWLRSWAVPGEPR